MRAVEAPWDGLFDLGEFVAQLHGLGPPVAATQQRVEAFAGEGVDDEPVGLDAQSRRDVVDARAGDTTGMTLRSNSRTDLGTSAVSGR